MLDDFRQEKQEPSLDPLSEGTSLPLSKKIALLCFAVALIGLFIFFTSDSWSSENKHSKHSKKQEITKELDQIKTRLSDLEMRLQPHVAQATSADSVAALVTPKESDASSAGAINLQALIEQELQESNAQTATKDDNNVTDQEESQTAPPAKKKAQTPTTSKKQQTYTVQKGDSLSKISQKVYGSTKYWKRIVEANKDKLGSSQTLRPGMTLVIPKEGDK